MQEITLEEFEENFNEILNKIEMGSKFLLRTGKDEGIILTYKVDESIQAGVNNGIIKKLK